MKTLFIRRSGQKFTNGSWSISDQNGEQIIKIGSELKKLF